MPTYPANPALEAAVAASAEDDTPRLAYADWLDENGDLDRAAFIRTQVALWDKHPADPDLVDLIERKRELLPALGRRFLYRGWSSTRIFGGYPSGEEGDDERAVWHRGFPFLYCKDTQGGPVRQPRWNGQIADVIRTTTVRGLLLGGSAADLAAFAAAPESRSLACLGIGNEYGQTPPPDSPLEPVLTSGEFPHLVWFITQYLRDPRDFALLGRASAFPHLRRFACRDYVYGTPDEVRDLFRGAWCSRLRRLEVNGIARYNAAALVEALPSLPELHTLEINRFPAEGFAALVGKSFPSLGRLRLGPQALPVPDVDLTALASAKLPRLAVLELPDVEWRADQLLAVSRSPTFERLRMLELDATGFGPRGVSVLADSASAATLRVLRLAAPAFSPDDLVAIAQRGAFPNLSTLAVCRSRAVITAAPNAPELADALRNASWPHLRHLDLGGCPLGDPEAVALAGNPTLANLRTLNLRDTGVGGKGIAAAVSSPHFQNLVSLCLSGLTASSNLEVFSDLTILQRLADCSLPRDLSDLARNRLAEARPGVFH